LLLATYSSKSSPQRVHTLASRRWFGASQRGLGQTKIDRQLLHQYFPLVISLQTGHFSMMAPRSPMKKPGFSARLV
jgi:hypothetical protein